MQSLSATNMKAPNVITSMAIFSHFLYDVIRVNLSVLKTGTQINIKWSIWGANI